MKKLLLTLTGYALIHHVAWADTVYVTARPSPCTVTANCPGPNLDGTYTETNFPNLGDFGAVGTAAGHPQTTVARTYISSALITDTNAGVDLTPKFGVPGAVYQIDYNFNSNAGNTATDVVYTVIATSATLSFTNTDKFQRQYGSPSSQWQFMGYLTNNPGVTNPTLQFRYASGRISGSGGNRMLFDCWRFTLAQPCLAVPVVSVTGPLSTNLNQVVVAGVSASATNVFVYQDSGGGMVLIGSKLAGVTAGNNTVTVSGLVKNARVAATQKINGQEGCTPVAGSGAQVGGGANASVRIALSIRETTSTGPEGSPGDSSSGNLHFLGASAATGASGAPTDSAIIYPSNGWQTVTFLRGTNEVVGDPASTAGTLANGAGYAANDTVSIQVYGYRTLPNGVTIYSVTPALSSDLTSNNVFTVNWTWSAVADAQGYRLLRNLDGAGYGEYRDVAALNLSDANTGWNAGATVTPTTSQSGKSVQWNPTLSNTNNLPGQWGILESINFSLATFDNTGPFDLYIDNLKNGSILTHTFEDAPASTTDYGFRQPTFSGTTSGGLLDAPNVGVVSNGVADTGTKSFHVQFQWNGTNVTRWLRLTTSGVNNPQVNLDEPISFRLLMQPVNASLPAPPAAPALSISHPAGVTVLNWTGGHRLQSSTDVRGTYTNLPQVLSANTWTNVTLGAFLGPWTNNLAEPNRFFRLKD